MTEQGIRQGDESVAPGLHMGQFDSGRLGALSNIGEEQSSSRRITAESFRLLQAKLKQSTRHAPTPTVIPAIQPVATIQGSAVVPAEPDPVEVIAERPSFPVFASDQVEAETPETELPIKATEPDAEAVAVEPEVEAVDAETEAEFEVVAAQPEFQLIAAKPEVELVAAEREAEPANTEIAAEPVAVEPEIEFHATVAEVTVEQSRPDSGQVEDHLYGAAEAAVVDEELFGLPIFRDEPAVLAAQTQAVEENPQQQGIAAEHLETEIVELEAAVPEPESVAAADNSAVTDCKVAAASDSDPVPAFDTPKSKAPSVSSVEIQGIGEIAKSIYITPSSADRTAFLAECAAMAAAEAEAEHARAEIAAVTYSAQFPPAKAKIRRAEPEDDPFAKIILDDPVDGIMVLETDDDAAELARSLLDMMLSSPSAGLPQERALAADALLKLVPRIPLRAMVAIVERVSIMEQPPHLLVTKLISDPRIEVAGPLLELCNHISDQVLSKVIASGQVSLQRLIARRRHISAVISDQLIQFDDTSVILTLIRNNGVTISHAAFSLLADHARRHPAVLAPLATRADLPAPIAFELFWFVPAELRRYLLSRFLTDSETLTKILKITQTMKEGEHAGEPKFAEREEIEALVALLQSGKIPEAAEKLQEIGGIQLESALRIISDRDGEPLAIMFKALGTNRGRFGEIIVLLKTSDFGIIRGDREVDELQNVFDSMSFNKARVLLTYWDWAALKSGPYAPAN